MSCSLGLESIAPCFHIDAPQQALTSHELIMKGVQQSELLLGA